MDKGKLIKKINVFQSGIVSVAENVYEADMKIMQHGLMIKNSETNSVFFPWTNVSSVEFIFEEKQ